jgi:hypothetical protein
MNPLIIILGILLINLAAASVLLKHRRNVRHHRSTTPLIGRHPQLTEALHSRLSARQPETDWLNPANMRAKVNAWRRNS